MINSTSWETLLKASLYDDGYMERLNIALKEEYSKYNVFPGRDQIFRALEFTKPQDVKVVILGQDPYPQKISKADGIAFSSSSTVIPPSLLEICSAIEEQLYDGLCPKLYGDSLFHLCNQGILMLNSSLTVIENKPNSHKHFWIKFRNSLVTELSKSKDDIIWLLLGQTAQEVIPFIYGKQVIMKREHPAAATRELRKWKSNDCFKIIQSHVAEKYNQEIVWYDNDSPPF